MPEGQATRETCASREKSSAAPLPCEAQKTDITNVAESPSREVSSPARSLGMLVLPGVAEEAGVWPWWAQRLSSI